MNKEVWQTLAISAKEGEEGSVLVEQAIRLGTKQQVRDETVRLLPTEHGNDYLVVFNGPLVAE